MVAHCLQLEAGSCCQAAELQAGMGSVHPDSRGSAKALGCGDLRS